MLGDALLKVSLAFLFCGFQNLAYHPLLHTW